VCALKWKKRKKIKNIPGGEEAPPGPTAVSSQEEARGLVRGGDSDGMGRWQHGASRAVAEWGDEVAARGGAAAAATRGKISAASRHPPLQIKNLFKSRRRFNI
jgi:hypothetical protein